MTEQDPAMKRARERAGELKDFYKHLITYVLVCGLLVVIDLADSDAGADTFIGLKHTGVEHLRLDDLFGEDVRAFLIANFELILEALGDHEQRRIALALEKGIGGNRGAHFNLPDSLRWYG